MKRYFSLNVMVATVSMLFLFAGGCDTVNQQSYQQSYIVEGYLVEGNTLPQILLSTDQEVKQRYEFNQTAVDDAIVTIHHVDSSNSIIESYEYRMTRKGTYSPVNEHLVKGGKTYRLDISIPQDQNHKIISTTTVPTGFTIEDVLNDSTQYKGPNLASARCTPSFYKDRQSYYLLTILNDVDESRLTPLFAELMEDDDELELEDFAKISSGILNEASMLAFGDGDIRVELPWSAVVFFGESQVVFSTIDDNLYNFVSSQSVQLSDGNHISPGEIYDLKYNIEGGVGIFGSYAADTASVFIYQ